MRGSVYDVQLMTYLPGEAEGNLSFNLSLSLSPTTGADVRVESAVLAILILTAIGERDSLCSPVS